MYKHTYVHIWMYMNRYALIHIHTWKNTLNCLRQHNWTSILGRILNLSFHQQLKEQSLPSSSLWPGSQKPFPQLPLAGWRYVRVQFGHAGGAAPSHACGDGGCGLTKGEDLLLTAGDLLSSMSFGLSCVSTYTQPLRFLSELLRSLNVSYGLKLANEFKNYSRPERGRCGGKGR